MVFLPDGSYRHLFGVLPSALPSFPFAFHKWSHISTKCTQWGEILELHCAEVREHSSSRTVNAMASRSTTQRTQYLDWFPFNVHRVLGDLRYRGLKDYQQAWFLNLLCASWVSERPGYLPDNGQLWRLANARTRQFFEKECAPVMHMFEREGSTTDGAAWIYNRDLLKLYDEQVLKFHRKKQKSAKSTSEGITSYLDFEGTLKKGNGREKCEIHPHSGLTEWGTCWGCYEQKYSSQCG